MTDISNEEFEALKRTQLRKTEGMVSYTVPTFVSIVSEGVEETIHVGDEVVAKMIAGVCYKV